MSDRNYLKYPDDFRDQLITQRTGFVPFTHHVSQPVREITGDQVRQADMSAVTEQQLSDDNQSIKFLQEIEKVTVIIIVEHDMIIIEQEYKTCST